MAETTAQRIKRLKKWCDVCGKRRADQNKVCPHCGKGFVECATKRFLV